MGQGGFDSAISIANAATTTANTALSNSRQSNGQGGFDTAISVANDASATATAAANAVSTAAFYSPIGVLANLPSSPSNEDRVEVVNSTGVESNSNVSGVPTGFVGSSLLTVRLQYNSSTSKWEWQQYFAVDPENQYQKKSYGFIETLQTLSTSAVIAANTNAGLMGPTVALASGVTITVGSNSQLTVLS